MPYVLIFNINLNCIAKQIELTKACRHEFETAIQLKEVDPATIVLFSQ